MTIENNQQTLLNINRSGLALVAKALTTIILCAVAVCLFTVGISFYVGIVAYMAATGFHCGWDHCIRMFGTP